METQTEKLKHGTYTEPRTFVILRSALDVTYYALLGVLVCWVLRNTGILLGFGGGAAPITSFIGYLTAGSMVALTLLRFLKLKNTEWTLTFMSLATTCGIVSTLSIGGCILRNSIYETQLSQVQRLSEYEEPALSLPVANSKGLEPLNVESASGRASGKDLKLKFFEAKERLKNSLSSGSLTFGPEVQKKINEYIVWLDANGEPSCASKVTDAELKQKEDELLGVMRKEIEQDQAKLIRLR